MTRYRTLFAGVALAAMINQADLALAQVAVEKAVSEPAELIVTGRRRDERIIDVPASIRAFGAEELQNAKIDTLNDIAARVPNFNLTEQERPGVALINIRGIGQARTGEPPIAYVVDGVQALSPLQITQQLLDVERVEVLKGPQSPLYGRNAIGGAVVVTTREPGRDVEMLAQFGFGTGRDVRAAAMLGGPVIDDVLSARVAIQYRDFGGDISNVNTGDKANPVNDLNIRARVVFRPADRWKLDLRAARLAIAAGGAWNHQVGPGRANDDGPFRATFSTQTGRVLDEYSAKLDAPVGLAGLSLVAAKIKAVSTFAQDIDLTPPNGLNATNRIEFDGQSLEARLASSAGGTIDWLVGGYINRVDFDNRIAIIIPPNPATTAIQPPGSIVIPTTAIERRATEAGFAQLKWTITPEVSIGGAVRYDQDRVRSLTLNREVTSSAWQPRLEAVYSPNAGQRFYASVSRGYRAAGFNAVVAIAPSYKAERVWSYEVGSKLSGCGAQCFFGVSAFYNDISDRQVFAVDFINAAQTIINPIRKAKAYGLEADIVLRLKGGLSIDASLGFLETRIDSYDPALLAGQPTAGNFTGKKLPFSPAVSYAVAASYAIDLTENLAVIPRIEVNGHGPSWWEIDNRERRKAVTLVNARVNVVKGPLSISLYVENVFDQAYNLEFLAQRWTGAPGGDLATSAPPRRAGVLVTTKF